LKFAQICPKQALKYTVFVNIQKRPKMAKWLNHFYSGKQFQKRPNGKPSSFFYKETFRLERIKVFVSDVTTTTNNNNNTGEQHSPIKDMYSYTPDSIICIMCHGFEQTYLG